MQSIDNILNLTTRPKTKKRYRLSAKKRKVYRRGRVFVKKAENQKETFIRHEIDWSIFPHPKVIPVNENEMKIEEMYCTFFGCDNKLSLRESLFGDRCIKHSGIEETLCGDRCRASSKKGRGCFFKYEYMKKTKKEIDNYVPYGPEWEREMMKLPKKFLIDMIKKINTEAAEKEYSRIWCGIKTNKG